MEQQWTKTLILIPTLSPSRQFLDYIDDLIMAGFTNILVVDDGSKEEYQQIFEKIKEKSQCRVFRHGKNLGKGRGIKNGINYYLNLPLEAQGNGLITVDSDGQHAVEDVVAVAKELGKGKEKLILGVRDFWKKSDVEIPWKSSFGNRITTVVFKLLFGTWITDTQTGLRGISRNLAEGFVDLEGERFEYEMNMLIYGVRNKIEIQEYPIKTIYLDNNSESHFHPLRDSLKIYGLIFTTFFKYLIASLSSFFIDIAIFQLLILFLTNAQASVRIGVATVIARILSSLWNFAMNKNLVFQSDASVKTTLIKYYILCAIQMAVSALLVTGLYQCFGVSETILKMIVDSLLFFVSFFIQQNVIFTVGKK